MSITHNLYLSLINHRKRTILSKQIIQYFRTYHSQSQIRVSPLTDSFSYKYPNINIFTLNGGKITISQERNSSGDFVYTVTCLAKDKTTIGDSEFSALTDDEAFKKADHWLLKNYTLLFERPSTDENS